MTFHQLVERRTDGQTRQVDKVHSRPTTFPITLMPLSDGLDIWTSQFSISPAGPLFNGKWFHIFLTSVATSQNRASRDLILIISLVVTKSDSDHREMFHLQKVTFSTALSEREMVTRDNSGRLMRGLGCKWNNFGRFMERGRNWPNYDKSMWEVTPI